MRLNLSIIKSIPALLLLAAGFAPIVPHAAPQAAATVGPDRAGSIDAARRLNHLLDYVSRDYAGAVENGVITSPVEYDEQLEMADHIAKLSARLPGLAADPQFQADLMRLKPLMIQRGPAPEVAGICQRMRTRLLEKMGIATFPLVTPDLEAGRLVYEKNCAACHGATGKGDGPSSKDLNPKPADMTGDRLAGISPYQIANTARFGVDGTGMAAHSSLKDDEIWNVSFFVATLRHTPSAPPPESVKLPFTLREISARSDLELAQRHPSIDPALIGWIRHHPPAPDAEAPDLGVARALLDQALIRYAKGDTETARRLALDAYLDGVEPLEPKLKTRNTGFVPQVEERLGRLRFLMAQSAPAAVVAREGSEAVELLDKGDRLLVEKGLSPVWLLTSAAAILLREGLEAVLIVVMLLGLAGGTGARRARLATHAGWLIALLGGFATWGVSRWLMTVSGAGRETIEGVTGLLAVAVLLYVGFWLHSKTEIGKWHDYLKGAAGGGGLGFWGAFSASFLAVYREVFETVLFFQTLWFDAAAGHRIWLILGIVLGGGAVATIAWLMLVLERRLPIKQFFTLSAITMLILSVILCGKGIHALQISGWIPLHPLPFNIPSALAPIADFFGIYATFESILGQLLVAIVGWGLWWISGRSDTKKSPSTPEVSPETPPVSG